MLKQNMEAKMKQVFFHHVSIMCWHYTGNFDPLPPLHLDAVDSPDWKVGIKHLYKVNGDNRLLCIPFFSDLTRLCWSPPHYPPGSSAGHVHCAAIAVLGFLLSPLHMS